MNLKWRIVLPIAGAAALAGSHALSRPAPSAPVAAPPMEVDLPPVGVQPVRMSTDAIPVRATGFLNRRQESPLAFHRSGILAEVLVRQGDFVEPGQVLARLRLDDVEAALAKARSQMEKARRDVARYQLLKDQRAVSIETWQNAQTELEAAESQLKVAEFDRRYAEILAPGKGAILTRKAEPDEWVDAGRTILEFGAESGGWIVQAFLAANDAARLAPGDPASFANTTGRIVRIAEAADPVTRTIGIEVECDAPPSGARSHQIVDLRITPRPVEQRPVVPASALIAGDRDTCRMFLWDRETGTAHSIQVEVSGFQDDVAFLRSHPPLDHGWVVATGAEYLKDGMKVKEAARP